MTAGTFVVRVTVESALAIALLAAVTGWLGGAVIGVGVLAGGVLALGNLWWLAGRAILVTTSSGAHWSPSAMLRLAVTAAAIAVLFGTGLAHPVGVVLGLTVLPFALIARGLAAAREA